MRLYVTTLGQWAGTQAEARAFKATHVVDFEQIEVPTDKAGLIEFLNRHEVGALAELPDRGQMPEPVPDASPRDARHPLTTMAIEDWCGDAAPHQLGTVVRAASLRLQQISQEVAA